ncbi:transmembrane family of transporters domain-containing protein [Ditylenchus destructor]|uniref:Transmembrane family of transporters domain-containing protein n=1 Tax=Ditylenchus destructor TaxID=166010 RepID=A0AAD4MZ77_9BILA|nr:transmembrane family of transporters domain-containing protein [Ditylenchus destructor]
MKRLIFGLMESLISAGLFGSSMVLVKKRGIGDGMFAQWVMGVSIMMGGFVIFVLKGFPAFNLVAAGGGVVWAIGNALFITIIDELGIGPAYLLPDTTNCLFNFFVGYFGLFWTKPRPPRCLWLALVGLALILIGGVLVSLVKHKKHECLTSSVSSGSQADLERGDSTSAELKEKKKSALPKKKLYVLDEFTIRRILTKFRRPLFIALAFFIGIFYALCSTSVIAAQDSAVSLGLEREPDTISYVFSNYSGTFFMTTLMFIVYSMIKGNKPNIDPQIFLGAYTGGVFWSIAMVFWLFSAQNLSQSITGPITAMLPGCFASLWSVFYFKEIQGKKNLCMLSAAIICMLIGAFVIGLSRYNL